MEFIQVTYSNRADTGAYYRSVFVKKDGKHHKAILDSLEFHFGFGGEDKEHLYIDVNDWDKFINMINKDISEDGYDAEIILRKQVTTIKKRGV